MASMIPTQPSGYNQAYFDAYHEVPDYRLRYPDENVIRFLASNFRGGDRAAKRILDLGCGIGRHLVLLADMRFQAYGIDGSPVAVALATQWIKDRGLSADVRTGLITELPFEDNLFDGVIEHAALVTNSWEDILKACAECHRVLRDGGVGFFLLKRRQDCAFTQTTRVARNTYLVDEATYISRKTRSESAATTFRAFTRADIAEMFREFGAIRVHTWDTSFKGLELSTEPGVRRTAYWIVLVQK